MKQLLSNLHLLFLHELTRPHVNLVMEIKCLLTSIMNVSPWRCVRVDVQCEFFIEYLSFNICRIYVHSTYILLHVCLSNPDCHVNRFQGANQFGT